MGEQGKLPVPTKSVLHPLVGSLQDPKVYPRSNRRFGEQGRLRTVQIVRVATGRLTILDESRDSEINDSYFIVFPLPSHFMYLGWRTSLPLPP